MLPVDVGVVDVGVNEDAASGNRTGNERSVASRARVGWEVHDKAATHGGRRIEAELA